MPTIADIRQQYPQYNDMSDADLAGALHSKFYSDMPKDEFHAKIGLKAQPATEPEKPRAWSDVPLEALKNIPSSAYDAAAGMVGQAAGVIKTTAPYVAKYGPSAPAMMAVDAGKAIYNDPDMLKRIPAGLWKGLVDRYGSEEALKRTIATDPAGFALDVSMLASGGEAALSRITRGVGDIGRAADVSRPFHELPPEPPPPPGPPPLPPGPPPVPLEPAQAAVREAVESQPRALTTGNRALQQTGQVLSKIPLIGDNLGRAIEAVPGKFGEARNAVADDLGNYRTPQNVASDIRGEIGGAAEAETRAAEQAAQQADAAAQANWEQTNQARERAIAGFEAQSARETGQQVGNTPTTDMGQTSLDTVRANHDIARNTKDAAYREAGGLDATVLDDANADAHRSVLADLRSDRGGQGTVDTSAAAAKASRGMLAKLRRFSLDARNRVANAQEEAINGGGTAADADATGQSMQRVEQLRQDLNFHASGADNDADRRAASRIISAFDDWHGRAVENHLMDGSDPNALPAFQRARALNRDFRERFGYNADDPAGKTINKMVRGEPGEHIGPNEIAKALTGNPDRAGPLLDSIYAATGDHPNHQNVVQAVRGGFWNHLAGTVEGSEKVRPAAQIQDGVFKFTRGPGRDLAARVFTPQDQALMERHANVLTAAERAREQTAALNKANKPVPTEVQKGPLQELADRVLGRGEKAPEAVYNAIEGYAKSKGGGKDIATLAKVMNSLPPELRGNFRNTFIRRLGTGVKGEFSPAVFAKEWIQNVNPQAKAVLFGDGAHVRALDELADASRTFDEVHRRFGNPTGSGHTVNFAKVATVAAAAATGALLGPVKLLGGWFVGRKFANFLATPQGAASASRFAKQMQRLQDVPSLANAAAARLSVRNMRNTATTLGIAHDIPDVSGK